MARIAEQRDAPDAPARHRRTHHQRPLERHWDVADERLHVVVPSGEIGRELLGGAARAPGLDLPVGALQHADEVHDLAGAQRVVHDVSAGTDPVRADHAHHMARQPHHGDDAAPGDDAGELRLVGTEEPLADAGMHAIRAHQNVPFRRATVFELQSHACFSLVEADAPCAEMDCGTLLAPHRALEHAEEVGAVYREIRVAVALDRNLAQVVELPALARVPDADLLTFGLAGKRVERLAHAERVQDVRAVRRELDPGADLAQLGRLLVHLDLAAHPRERQGSRQPADSPSGDQDPRIPAHPSNIHAIANLPDSARATRWTAQALRGKLAARGEEKLMKNATLAAAACAAALAALSTLALADDDDRGRFPRDATFTTLAVTPLAIEGLTADDAGNLYTTGRDLISDVCPVWKFTGSPPTVTRTTVGFIPNPSTARCNPSGIAFDAHGNLYIADGGPAATVWKLTPNEVTPPLASAFATGVPGTNGLAFDSDGNLWTG